MGGIPFRDGIFVFRGPASGVISYLIRIGHSRLQSGHRRFVYIISRHSLGSAALGRHHLKCPVLHGIPAYLSGASTGGHPVQANLFVCTAHFQAQIFNGSGIQKRFALIVRREGTLFLLLTGASSLAACSAAGSTVGSAAGAVSSTRRLFL